MENTTTFENLISRELVRHIIQPGGALNLRPEPCQLSDGVGRAAVTCNGVIYRPGQRLNHRGCC